MNILINDAPHAVPEHTTLAQVIALIDAAPPYAAAVNQQFVPRSKHDSHVLQNDDRVEVIRPVTGG
jgi:sulfur carrier protein